MNDSAVKYRLIDLFRDILHFLRPYKKGFLFGTLCRVVADIAWLYPAYGFATLITFLSTYQPGTPLQPAWIVLGLWTLVMIVRYGGIFLAKFYCFRIAERMGLDSQLESIKRLFLLDISWHERENAGNKLKRIQKGSLGIDEIAKIWVTNLIEITIRFVGMTFIIYTIDPTMSFILIVFIVIYLPLSSRLLRGAVKAARAVMIKEEEVQGLFFEGINNIRSAKVMGMIPELLRRVTGIVSNLFDLISKRVLTFQRRATGLGMFAGLFKMGVFIFIVWGISQGRYELGFLVLFNSYFNDLKKAMEELADSSEKIAVAKYGIARMMSIINEPLRIDDEENKVPFPVDWQTVSLKNVSFGYGSNEVLKNISFDIRRGEKIGVVGLSGAGKSTLFKLLLKEHEDYDGDILYDDLSLRDISKEKYFYHVAVVLQETEVFNFSLRDNITIADPRGLNNQDNLRKAMDVAHVTEFVNKLPKGVETLIGEKGVKLSGGEKQRLGIARAVFKSPQILFLDEATSHLDLESEDKIQDSLTHFFKDVTAVVIAHRLTTIREMDKILVLEDGQIVEQGSWNSLMKKRGRFRELWDKQRL